MSGDDCDKWAGAAKKAGDVLLAFCLLFFHSAIFANTNDTLKAYQAEGLRQALSVPNAKVRALHKASLQNSAENKGITEDVLQQMRRLQGTRKTKEPEGAILFVSFSMPDTLLLALADEAARFDIPVVINGLVDGDFKKTINTFKRLQKKAQKVHFSFQGVSIDPLWFAEFHVTSVPALVVTEGKTCPLNTSCKSTAFDVVYGNARIKDALTIIARKGEAAPLRAHDILEQGHV